MARGSTERSLGYGRLAGTPESGKGEQQAMAEAIPLRYLPADGFEAKTWYELMTIYRDLCPGSQAAYGPRWIFRGEGEVRGDRALRPSLERMVEKYGLRRRRFQGTRDGSVSGATMYWSDADAATYRSWLVERGFGIISERFVPESSGGHVLFLAQAPNAS
jgi:hypothetical protein